MQGRGRKLQAASPGKLAAHTFVDTANVETMLTASLLFHELFIGVFP